MPKSIPESTQIQIALFWILGYTDEEIAGKTGVSKGTVRNRIADLKAGKYPEYRDFIEYLDEMRLLAQRLRSEPLILQEARVGLAIRDGVVELGIDPTLLLEIIQLFERIKQPGTTPEDFIAQAIRYVKLEEATKIPYEKLEESYRKLLENVTALADEETQRKASVAKLREEEEHLFKQYNVTRRDLETYSNAEKALNSFGLKTDDMKATAEFIREIKEPALVSAATELASLRSETGKSYRELIDDYRNKSAQRARFATDIQSSEQKLRELRLQISEAETERRTALAMAHATQEQLKKFVRTSKELEQHGVPVERMNDLAKLLKELNEAGYDSKAIIRYIEQIGSLRKAVEETAGRVEVLSTELEQKRNALKELLGRKAETETQLKQVDEALQKAKADLKLIEQTGEERAAKILFAESLIALFLDCSSVKDWQMDKLVVSMRETIRTRKEAPDLRIDFSGIREEAKSLLEAAVGQKLVLRETYENELRNLRAQNEDLLLDRLGKLEGKRKELNEWERSVNQRAEELKKATWDRLREVLIAEFEEGNMKRYQCDGCTSIFLVPEKREPIDPWSCPRCLGRLRKISPS